MLRSWTNKPEGLQAKLDCVVHADPPAEVKTKDLTKIVTEKLISRMGSFSITEI